MLLIAASGPNVPADLRTEAIAVANEATQLANYELSNPTMTDATSTPDAGADDTVATQGQSSAPVTATQTASAPAPQSQAHIDVFLTDNTQTADQTFATSSGSINRDNTVFLGATLYNDDGSMNRSAQMTVTTDDATQDKTLFGTGNILPGGNPYYPFVYTFKSSGPHTINFTANGQTQSITLSAQ